MLLSNGYRLPFKKSSALSLGIELEFQIIDRETFDLTSQAKSIIRNAIDNTYHIRIKPEITQSMIEINTSVHSTIAKLQAELNQIKNYLVQQANAVNVYFAGGGAHAFQLWKDRKIFPSPRFKKIAKIYGYISKQDTIFGQHVHIGCDNADDAIYLTHALARYVPQLIAMSASSPFYQGIDTGYYSVRSNFSSFGATSGIMPQHITNWDEFAAYFYQLKRLGIIDNTKDIYWDVRPKPEFGTVEIRVCDTPLTFQKAICLTAYLQTLSGYLLQEKPPLNMSNCSMVYDHNRFHASRYGYQGDFINPSTLQTNKIQDDILQTMQLISAYAERMGNTEYLETLKRDVISQSNDAILLRNYFHHHENLKNLLKLQCKLWNTA